MANNGARRVDPSTSIWIAAYKGLRENEKELMDHYEQELETSKTGTRDAITRMLESEDGEELRKLLASNLKPLLDKEKAHEGTHEIVDTAIDAVSQFKNSIGNALTAAYPPAGLAWAGLCAAAPYAARIYTEHKNMWKGLDYVVDHLGWYTSICGVLLGQSVNRDEDSEADQAMRTELIALYQSLIRYQICVVDDAKKKKVTKWLRRAAGFTNWAEELKNVTDLQDKVDRRRSDYAQTKQLRDTSDILRAIRDEQAERAWLRTSERIGRFKVVDYEAGLRKAEFVRGTCEWFGRHQRFRQWLEATDAEVLVVSADPGCGKSVLSRFLVQDFLPWTPLVVPGDGVGSAQVDPESRLSDTFIKQRRLLAETPTVLYFFFEDTSESRNKTATSALCSLLHALFSAQRDLMDEYAEAVDTGGDALASDFSALFNIFSDIVIRAGPIVIVLDALDECDFGDLQRLLARLKDLLEEWRAREAAAAGTEGMAKVRVKFLFTTRGYSNILGLLDTLGNNKVYLSGGDEESSDQIQKEIGIVIGKRLEDLGSQRNLNEEQVKSIREALQGGDTKQRTYLWVSLVFDAIEKLPHSAGVHLLQDLARRFPPSLWGAYETLLGRVADNDRDDVRTLVHLVLVATRPLSLREAKLALRVRGRIGAKNEESLGLVADEDFRQWVRFACGFFLSVHSGRVYFLHQTAKEFLLRDQSSCDDDKKTVNGADAGEAASGRRWARSLTEREAQATMAESCIAYLSLRHFGGTFFTREATATFPQRGFYGRGCDDPAVIAHVFEVDANQDKALAFLERYGFLSYACENWLRHFSAAQLIEDGILKEDIQKDYVAPYLALFRVDSPEKPNLAEAQPWFRIALYFLLQSDRVDLDLVVKEAICMDAAGHVAAYFGHLRLLEAHLKPQKPPLSALESHEDPKPSFLLHWAALGGSSACALLLTQDMRDDACLPGSNRSPLVWAAAQGHIEALETLLSDIDINHTHNGSQNALLDTICVLLEHPDTWARPRFCERLRAAIKLLVSAGAQVTVVDEAGNTILHYLTCLPFGIDEDDPAVDARAHAVVEHETPANVTVAAAETPSEKQGERANEGQGQHLSLSILKLPPEDAGHEPQYSADGYASYFEGEDFLDLYDDSVIKYLMDHGIGPLVQKANLNGETTPLHVAAGACPFEPGRLASQASRRHVNARPGQAAHPWELVFLLYAGADIQAKDSAGRTPLFYAVMNGDVRRVRVLLAHGADPNVVDNVDSSPAPRGLSLEAGSSGGYTPLHHAIQAAQRAQSLVYHLLLRDAKIDAMTADGNTLLHLACKVPSLHPSLLKLFIKKGVIDVEVRNHRGWTALHCAAYAGHRGAVKALVAGGANPQALVCQTGPDPDSLARLATFPYGLNRGATMVEGPRSFNRDEVALQELAKKDPSMLVNIAKHNPSALLQRVRLPEYFAENAVSIPPKRDLPDPIRTGNELVHFWAHRAPDVLIELALRSPNKLLRLVDADTDGQTALHLALSKNCDIKMVELLISLKVPAQVLDMRRRTPLHILYMQMGRIETRYVWKEAEARKVVEVLHMYGIDLSARTEDEETYQLIRARSRPTHTVFRDLVIGFSLRLWR